jgi:hypothetical protein
MKLRNSFPTIFLSALCLISPNHLRAQTVKRWTPAEILAHAKPGQWVEIDGVLQKESAVLALEIEFRAGDFMDDDWRLLAKVKEVTPTKNQLQVLWVPVKVTKETEFDDKLKNLEDIKPEMLLKLEGTFTNDGIFLAKEISDRSRKLKVEPDFEGMLELVGRIGQVDEAKQMITVMGIQFQITEETEGKSLIK